MTSAETIKGVLIPASTDLQAHGYSHLLLDDHRGIYLIHHCRKSMRLTLLNRTRVEIHGHVLRPSTFGEHPRMFVDSYRSADAYLNFEQNLESAVHKREGHANAVGDVAV